MEGVLSSLGFRNVPSNLLTNGHETVLSTSNPNVVRLRDVVSGFRIRKGAECKVRTDKGFLPGRICEVQECPQAVMVVVHGMNDPIKVTSFDDISFGVRTALKVRNRFFTPELPDPLPQECVQIVGARAFPRLFLDSKLSHASWSTTPNTADCRVFAEEKMSLQYLPRMRQLDKRSTNVDITSLVRAATRVDKLRNWDSWWLGIISQFKPSRASTAVRECVRHITRELVRKVDFHFGEHKRPEVTLGQVKRRLVLKPFARWVNGRLHAGLRIALFGKVIRFFETPVTPRMTRTRVSVAVVKGNPRALNTDELGPVETATELLCPHQNAPFEGQQTCSVILNSAVHGAVGVAFGNRTFCKAGNHFYGRLHYLAVHPLYTGMEQELYKRWATELYSETHSAIRIVDWLVEPDAVPISLKRDKWFRPQPRETIAPERDLSLEFARTGGPTLYGKRTLFRDTYSRIVPPCKHAQPQTLIQSWGLRQRALANGSFVFCLPASFKDAKIQQQFALTLNKKEQAGRWTLVSTQRIPNPQKRVYLGETCMAHLELNSSGEVLVELSVFDGVPRAGRMVCVLAQSCFPL